MLSSRVIYKWNPLTQKWLMIFTSIVLMMSLSGVSISLKPVATPALLMRIVTCGRIRYIWDHLSTLFEKNSRSKCEGHRRALWLQVETTRGIVMPDGRCERENSRRKIFLATLPRRSPPCILPMCTATLWRNVDFHNIIRGATTWLDSSWTSVGLLRRDSLLSRESFEGLIASESQDGLCFQRDHWRRRSPRPK